MRRGQGARHHVLHEVHAQETAKARAARHASKADTSGGGPAFGSEVLFRAIAGLSAAGAWQQVSWLTGQEPEEARVRAKMLAPAAGERDVTRTQAAHSDGNDDIDRSSIPPCALTTDAASARTDTTHRSLLRAVRKHWRPTSKVSRALCPSRHALTFQRPPELPPEPPAATPPAPPLATVWSLPYVTVPGAPGVLVPGVPGVALLPDAMPPAPPIAAPPAPPIAMPPAPPIGMVRPGCVMADTTRGLRLRRVEFEKICCTVAGSAQGGGGCKVLRQRDACNARLALVPVAQRARAAPPRAGRQGAARAHC